MAKNSRRRRYAFKAGDRKAQKRAEEDGRAAPRYLPPKKGVRIMRGGGEIGRGVTRI